MRWLVVLCLLNLAASAAPILVLRGDRLVDENPGLADDVAAYATRVVTALRDVGAPVEMISDRDLTAARLAGAPLVVLPYNRLTDGQVESLAAYVAGGGRLACFFTTGSDRLPELLGLRRGALREPATDGQFNQIRFIEAARRDRSWLPEALDQGSWNAFELTPAADTRILAVWGDTALPAICENAAGVYIGHVLLPADRFDKGLFLLGLAAERQPALWRPALEQLRDRAVSSATRARSAWTAIAASQDIDARRHAQLERQVTELAAESTALPPADGRDPAPLLAAYLATRQKAEALMPQLATSPDQELRGIWVYGSRPVDWPAVAARYRDAGLNAVFYRVARGGSAVYPSAVVPQEEWSKGRDEVAAAIEACHRYGLEFHAWRVCWHLGSAPDDYIARLRAEGRLSTRYGGDTANFANPGDPRNQAVEHAAIREIVERYPEVDGVHLDYIRYTEVPDYDVDYGDVSRREFEQVLGRPIERWPFDVERGDLKWAYEDWMRENINRVVRQGAQDLRRLAPRVCYSAAVWRGEWRYKYAIKQDWPLWLQEGWLDLLVPMNYVTTTEDQVFYAERQMARTAGGTRLALGLGSWLLDDPGELISQVEVARRTGADGFVLFSANAGQIDDQLAALKQGATARVARPATAAPRARWRLPSAQSRRHEPDAVLAGTPQPVELELGPGCGTIRQELESVTATVSLHRPATGEDLGEVGRLVADGNGRAVFRGTFTPPTGRFQLEVRGVAVPTQGDGLPFRVRGPVLDGWTAEAAAAFAADHGPPARPATGPLVGVWFDASTDDGVVAALRAQPQLTAVEVRHFDAERLKPLDVLIVPQLADVGDWRPAQLTALRDWVAAGGTALLCHDAVGFRWHPTPFPELGFGDALRRGRSVVAAQPIGSRPVGWGFDHVYGDRVRLSLTPAAEVLLREPGEAGGGPIVARGRFGEGTVILCGMLTGATGGSPTMPAEEAALMLDLLGLAAPER